MTDLTHHMLTRRQARANRPTFGPFPGDIWDVIFDLTDAKTFATLSIINKAFHKMSQNKLAEAKNRFCTIITRKNDNDIYSLKKFDRTFHYLPNGDVWKYNAHNSADGKLVESFYYDPITKRFMFERFDLVKGAQHYTVETVSKSLKQLLKERIKYNYFDVMLTLEYITHPYNLVRSRKALDKFGNYHMIEASRHEFIYI